MTVLLEKNCELIRTFTQKSKSEDNCDFELIENLAKINLNEFSDCYNLSDISNPFVERTIKAILLFRNEIASVLKKCSGIWADSTVDNIWCFGPRHCGPNILLNNIKGVLFFFNYFNIISI